MRKDKETATVRWIGRGADGRLPIVEVDGVAFFVDERLRELRNVNDPFERLPLSMFTLGLLSDYVRRRREKRTA